MINKGVIGMVKNLSRKNRNCWLEPEACSRDEIFSFCSDYIDFLSECKTERECVEYIQELALENGFVPLDTLIKKGRKPVKGDRVLVNHRDKVMILFVIGEEGIEKGINLVGSHIDTPRMDLKPSPLYEEQGMALFKTHYYGGIKKYQWTAIPLALHGIVIKSNGEKLEIVVGEDPGDTVFTITDLLPHLAKEQMEKKASEVIPGEGLNFVVGTIPREYNEDGKSIKGVKDAVLELLKDRYGMEEEDFISAELTAVPAGRATDVGLDRSLVGGYGQDDRVCAYVSFRSIMDIREPKKTCAAVFVDKEEVGSMGNTGMQSAFFENALAELIALTGGNCGDLQLGRALSNSCALSADVAAAVDPNYPDTHDKENAPRLGNGICIEKYTGHRGKSGGSDANAEYIARIRQVFNGSNIIWQSGELGKVDLGGGGTIAQFLANYGMDVLDCGIPVLNMHSPFELASKADIYMAYKAYTAFYRYME
ncbi:MAG: aminopeptidase [Clostridia bacterium]